MEKRYVVVDEHKFGEGDRFATVHLTPEEANAEADYQWNHLTKTEQSCRHVYTAVVRRDMLPDYAIDEDTGEVDWSLFGDTDTFPGAFDSDKV